MTTERIDAVVVQLNRVLALHFGRGNNPVQTGDATAGATGP
jgi:hypothetical protein